MSCALLRHKVQLHLAGPVDKDSSLPFTDFASQLQVLQSQGQAVAAKFWNQQHKDHPCPATDLLLPRRVSYTNDLSTPTRGQSAHVSLACNLARLKTYSRAAGVTVASLFYAAWGLVLAKYTKSDSVCFGAVLSGRSLPITGMETVVGPTINTLPFFVSVRSQTTVQSYVQHVFSSLLRLTSFQWSVPEHGYSRNFLSAVNIRFETSPARGLAAGPLIPLEHPYSRVLSDIPIQIEVENCGRARLIYNTEFFYAAHMNMVASMLGMALDLIIDQSESSLKSFMNSVDGAHQKQLAKFGNWASDFTRPSSVDNDLVSLFSRTAEANPTTVAVEQGPSSLTYSDLQTLSSIAADRLGDIYSVKPGDVICVHADGTIQWIVAIYATLKAGAIYCPLDERLPDGVRDANFQAAGGSLFLTGQNSSKSASPRSATLCLSVEELVVGRQFSRHEQETERERTTVSPQSPAYLCFTSGSTGQPKGVLCRHDGLVAFQRDFDVRLMSRPGWRIAQIMYAAFDGSVHEIFSSLSYGATLVLKDKQRPLLHLRSCDAAILTPSLARVLEPEGFPSLQAVYLVGEPVSQDLCDTWTAKQGLKVFNMYGPTEATCGVTIKRLTRGTPVTLGVPCSSARIYILDSEMRLVPWGVVGELCIAGVQVASGYVSPPGNTSKKFALDHLNPQYTGELLYKTGDRAYWNEFGELVSVGRADRQVKLNGFRIDLDELEVQMVRSCEACTAAAVTVKGGYLVALVQPLDLDLQTFESRMRHNIPGYAFPRHITAVALFPTTLAGKVDYKAVAASVIFSAGSEVEDERGLASSSVETSVMAVVKSIMGAQVSANIDSTSSFHEMGIDSTLALALQRRISRALAQHVPVSLILGAVNVRSLADRIKRLGHDHRSSHQPRAQPTISLGDSGVSHTEKAWWDKYQQTSSQGTSSFNVTYACRLSPEVDQEKLANSWTTTLAEFPVLRSRFRWDLTSNMVIRHYAPSPPVCKRVAAIDIQREINTPFRLTSDEHLIRVFVAPKSMLVVISHIICDLTALTSILRRAAQHYHCQASTMVCKLYSQTKWDSHITTDCLSFWREYLAGADHHHRASPGSISDAILARRSTWSGSSILTTISADIYQAILGYTSAKRVTMNQLALAAVAIALQHDCHDCDIVLGMPYLNRHSEDDQDAVGLFLEPLPVRIRYPVAQVKNTSSADDHVTGSFAQNSFVKLVQQSSRAALSHAAPWAQLLSQLDISCDYPNDPLIHTMVSFHESSQFEGSQFPVKGATFLPTWAEGAKFKLMVEFTAASEGTLLMRLEYSDECLSRSQIMQASCLIVKALDALVADEDYAIISQKLKSCNLFNS